MYFADERRVVVLPGQHLVEIVLAGTPTLLDGPIFGAALAHAPLSWF
jgi:hypothetical protein